MDGDGRNKMAILLAYLLILTAQLILNSKKSTVWYLFFLFFVINSIVNRRINIVTAS